MDEKARLRKLLKRPLMTEKSVRLTEMERTYAFEVPRTANKVEIKRAIEEIFEVKVDHVRTINKRGKLKRLGMHMGRRSATKKALVKLEEGYSLELYENV